MSDYFAIEKNNSKGTPRLCFSEVHAKIKKEGGGGEGHLEKPLKFPGSSDFYGLKFHVR